MNAQKTDCPNDNPEPPCPLPRHPFFELSNEHASFVDCMDAIGHVGSMIELCDFLKLESDTEGGLSPNAAFGYYWVSVMMRRTLAYVSNRLGVLNKQQREKHQQEAVYLSALLTSLPTLGCVNRDRYLNSTAARMDITRSELDQFIRQATK